MGNQPIAKTGAIECYLWQSKAGHFCWEVRDDEGAIAGGAGYETTEEAESEMWAEYAEQTSRLLH